MTTTPTPRPRLDLLDGDWYANGPYADYAWFREHEPVAWDAGNELWGVFRHADLKDVEARSEHFVNSDRNKGVTARTCPPTRRSSAWTTRCTTNGASW